MSGLLLLPTKRSPRMHLIDCPIYPYRFGRRPSESIVDTIKQFHEENVEPA